MESVKKNLNQKIWNISKNLKIYIYFFLIVDISVSPKKRYPYLLVFWNYEYTIGPQLSSPAHFRFQGGGVPWGRREKVERRNSLCLKNI